MLHFIEALVFECVKSCVENLTEFLPENKAQYEEVMAQVIKERKDKDQDIPKEQN